MADVFVPTPAATRRALRRWWRPIEAQGWSVWWDPEIDPGQEFDRRIAAELKPPPPSWWSGRRIR